MRTDDSRAKECRAEGKVKDAELFQGYIQRASITKLLIISIKRLMYLFRAAKTAQGLVSLTLPEHACFSLRLLDSFLFPGIKIDDNDPTPNLLLTYTYVPYLLNTLKNENCEIWYLLSWNGS